MDRPTCSPDLNPIDHVRDELGSWARALRQHRKDQELTNDLIHVCMYGRCLLQSFDKDGTGYDPEEDLEDTGERSYFFFNLYKIRMCFRRRVAKGSHRISLRKV